MKLPIFNKPKVLGFLLKGKTFIYIMYSIYKNLDKHIVSLIKVEEFESQLEIDKNQRYKIYNTYNYLGKDFSLNLIFWDVIRFTKDEVTFSFLICFEKTHSIIKHKIYEKFDLKVSEKYGIGEILIFKYIKNDDNNIELFSVNNDDRKFLYSEIYSKKRKYINTSNKRLKGN